MKPPDFVRKMLIVAGLFGLVFLGFGLGHGPAFAGGIHEQAPDEPSPDARYLFYLHGSWIEKRGLKESHPHYGAYRYQEIVQALADQGFEVISETRFTDVPSQEYAASVADQARRLLAQGVPAGHVSVIGHSKGGQMTLIVAAILANDAIKYVVMAGCGQKNTEYRSGYEKFLKNKAARMKGRILSLYDEVDRTAGTCDEAFSLAKLQEQKEKVLLTGRGHGLFYAPEDEWIDAVVEWVGR